MRDFCSPRTKLLHHTWLLGLLLSSLFADPPLYSQEDGDLKLVLRQPPRASTRCHLPDFLPDATKLGPIAAKVSDALNEAGYTDQGWFVVPSAMSLGTAAHPNDPPLVVGFAVVTRLEQIEDNGQTKAGGERWALDLSPPTVGSFLDAAKLLLKGAPKGRYRVFLIMVSDRSVSQAASTPSTDDWQDFLRKGAKAPLMRVMESTHVSHAGGGGWYCFVYEYERSAIDGETQFVSSSKVDAAEHLKASGIWDALERAGKK